jgi:hypothetical protein
LAAEQQEFYASNGEKQSNCPTAQSQIKQSTRFALPPSVPLDAMIARLRQPVSGRRSRTITSSEFDAHVVMRRRGICNGVISDSSMHEVMIPLCARIGETVQF